MTDPEFAEFAGQLFVAFPSLWEWLQTKSPDALATQRVWRQTLRPYSAKECQDVLDGWTSGRVKPFSQFERDRVHLVVQACCEFARTERRRQKENEENRHLATAYSPYSDPGLLTAIQTVEKEAKEVWSRYRSGEIDFDEFQEELEPLKARAVAALPEVDASAYQPKRRVAPLPPPKPDHQLSFTQFEGQLDV